MGTMSLRRIFVDYRTYFFFYCYRFVFDAPVSSPAKKKNETNNECIRCDALIFSLALNGMHFRRWNSVDSGVPDTENKKGNISNEQDMGKGKVECKQIH